MKKVTYTTSGVTIFVCKCQYLWPSNSLIRRYNQFGNLNNVLHFSEVLKRNLIIKSFVG